MEDSADDISIRKQLSHELHHQIIKKFKRRKVIAHGIDSIWSADLVNMNPERGSKGQVYKYILTVIDIFSKYSWCIPLKSKTGSEITESFEKIFKDSGRIPKKIWCDKGTEFYNKTFQKFLKEHRTEGRSTPIELYSTESELKAC